MRSQFPNPPSLGLAASPARAAREWAAPGETGSRSSIASVGACSSPGRRGRVTFVNQRAALVLGALAGAGAAVLLGWRRGAGPAAPLTADPRAQELREKLEEARSAAVDEGDFDAAGMAAETIVSEEPGREPLPADEFEAMRRRVHEEARAAAD